jgi:hypothetical protein
MRWPWRRDTRHNELTDELQAHLEMAVQRRIERGESPAAAHENARREFGNVTHIAEVTRDMWGGASWDARARDSRYSVRGLRWFTLESVQDWIERPRAQALAITAELLDHPPAVHPPFFDRVVQDVKADQAGVQVRVVHGRGRHIDCRYRLAIAHIMVVALTGAGSRAPMIARIRSRQPWRSGESEQPGCR